MPKPNSPTKSYSGFTLIELLIVVAIIGILLSVGAAAYSAAQRNARNGQRQSDLVKISSALEQYYQDHNQYPTTPYNSGLARYDTQRAGQDCTAGGDALCCLLGGASASSIGICRSIDGVYKTYLTQVPIDPRYSNRSDVNAYYGYQSSGQFFTLLTKDYEGASAASLGQNFLTAANIGLPNSLKGPPPGVSMSQTDVYNSATAWLTGTGSSTNQYFVRSTRL